MTKRKGSTDLIKLLVADAQGVTDIEGRSGLDFLISRAQRMTGSERERLTADLTAAMVSSREDVQGWWSSLERLVVLCNLHASALGDAAEQALLSRNVAAIDRASMYAILDFCGKPQTATRIAADEVLKEGEHLRWLDLMVAKLPSTEIAQDLVIESTRAERFSFENFVQRVDEMRGLGGSHLGEWLRRFKSALSVAEHAAFDTFVNETFGVAMETSIESTSTQAHAFRTSDAQIRAKISIEPIPPSMTKSIQRINHAKSLAAAL